MSEKQFIILYDTLAPKIYRFVLAKVGSVEVAQDLTSETFLKAWDHWNKEKSMDISNPSAFLFRIARNLTTDYYRARARRPEVLIDENEAHQLGQIPDTKVDIGQMADMNWDMSRVKDILSKMAKTHPDYADVLILYYVEDIPVAEVAKVMERSEGATRVLLHRALNELRSRIEGT